MEKQKTKQNLKSFWCANNARIILILIISVFSAYSFFIATNLQRNIVPDEPFHFAVSQVFSSQWRIPDEVSYTRNMGIFIRRNPNLAYWIYGRALYFYKLIQPLSSEWQQLFFLRIFNSLFSIGMVIYTYLFSRELIKHKWWSLLPVFVLTNTLMFVLLSGGVNYDNLTNFLSVAGLYYLLRVLNNKNFIINSLAWLIAISFGSLIKETILPLALIMTVVWIIFIVKNKPKMELIQNRNQKTIILSLILLILVAANIAIYGINLIKHQSLTPDCTDYYSEVHCDSIGFAKRREQLALSEDLNIIEAFQQGYPEPLRYFFDTWIRAMLMKIFGIMGGSKSYYPIGIAYFHILLYWMIALGFRYVRKPSFRTIALSVVFGFYALTLFIKNYDIELAYGFIQVAHQGRYIFPVISVAFGLFSYLLFKVPVKLIRIPTLIATLFLFFYGGPIRFFMYYNSTFQDWFI